MASRSNRPRHPVQAFRVDPGWYAEHWLEEARPRSPGPAWRSLARAVAAARDALRSVPRLARRFAPQPAPELARPRPR